MGDASERTQSSLETGIRNESLKIMGCIVYLYFSFGKHEIHKKVFHILNQEASNLGEGFFGKLTTV